MGQFRKILNKTQGPSARLMDKAPDILKEKLARSLGYKYDFKGLNPFLKCLLATQHLQKQAHFIDLDYPNSRENFIQQMASIRSKPTKIKYVKDISLGLKHQTLVARHYHPKTSKKLPLVVFYHGGGFVVGDISTHDEACRLLAKHGNVQVLSIDYPLAPEHSPEYIVNSCVEALEWVYTNAKKLDIDSKRIAVAGDSAGGNLSAVVSQKTQYTVYAPSAQFLVYPAMDFKNRYASYYKFREGLILTDHDIDTVQELYLDRHNVDASDPIVSPIYGDYQKVAPAFVLTAGFDILHDEGQIYANRLKDVGIPVQYAEAKDQTHGFINFTPVHKAARQHWIKAAKDFRSFWDEQT